MFSRLYGSLMNARNSLYDTGVYRSHSLGAKTVSIGNITVGGTGKTPLVAFAAEVLAGNGEKVCVLTRGYGRIDARRRIVVSDGEKILADVRNAGDEPFELAGKLLGKAMIVADANRVAAAHWAREKFGITAFILDDAFQHRRATRDLDIVCVDATAPFGNGKTLPTGILREPPENLKRADVIVITRANLADDILNLKSRIAEFNADCPIFVSKNRISRLVNLNDFPAKAQSSLKAEGERQKTKNKCLAFCALGNPNNFFEQLRRENFDLVATHKFADHHFYTTRDVRELAEQAARSRAEILLTTAKDAVKLEGLRFDLPCLVVENDLIFEDDAFRNRLLTLSSES